MTVEEFLVWDAGDATGRRWQLVDGEPVLMAPAADVHGRIQAELIRLLGGARVKGARTRRRSRERVARGSSAGC
jgi:hypothetical protein